MSNILVLGHSGFIGTSLVQRLNSSGNHRVFLSNFRFSESTTVRQIREHIAEFPRQLTIINAVGYGLGTTSAQHSHLWASNTLWPISLTEALNTFGQKSRVLIHLASTLETLHHTGESKYADSKGIATKRLQELRATGQTPVSIVWLSNVYGPNQPRGRFIADLIDAARTPTMFPLRWPERRRRFTTVMDVVAHLEQVAVSMSGEEFHRTDYVVSMSTTTSLKEARSIAFKTLTGSDYPFRQEQESEFDAFASAPDDDYFRHHGAVSLLCNTPLETGLMIQFLHR